MRVKTHARPGARTVKLGENERKMDERERGREMFLSESSKIQTDRVVTGTAALYDSARSEDQRPRVRLCFAWSNDGRFRGHRWADFRRANRLPASRGGHECENTFTRRSSSEGNRWQRTDAFARAYLESSATPVLKHHKLSDKNVKCFDIERISETVLATFVR